MTTVLSQNETLEYLIDSALKRWEGFQNFARRTVMEAWYCGEALNFLREAMEERGEWGDWLQASDIPRSTAYRFMRLQRHMSVGEIAKHETVKKAYASLPRPPQEDVVVTESGVEVLPVRSPKVEDLLEREMLVEQARETETKNQELEKQLRVLQQKDAAVQAPDMVDVVENLVGQVEEWEGRYETLYGNHVELRNAYQRTKGALAKLSRELEKKQKRIAELELELGEAREEDMF